MIKLPRTLHLEGSCNRKNNPDDISFDQIKNHYLAIEEKVDGSGVAIFLDSAGEIQAWHRGSPAISKEYYLLHDWIQLNYEELFYLLEKYILFGEWMYHTHTIKYNKLPCFFLESDMYDLENQFWLNTTSRQEILAPYPFIYSVPTLAMFKPSSIEQITNLIKQSNYSDQLMEGLYIKEEDDLKVVQRLKYVRSEFLDLILVGPHWKKKPIALNSLDQD